MALVRRRDGRDTFDLGVLTPKETTNDMPACANDLLFALQSKPDHDPVRPRYEHDAIRVFDVSHLGRTTPKDMLGQD